MKRVVHYAAHGRGGLAFACYFRALRATLDSPKRLTAREQAQIVKGWHPEGHHTFPWPLRHTDLRRITCRECWTEIRKLARAALAPKSVQFTPNEVKEIQS